MEETPHLVTHFMAVGAEKRLEDYHFLRNTYETITGQEIQLNRILRMLGEDEISLNWRLDLSPTGRAQARSLHDFDRWANTLVLKGSMAYERLREVEQDNSKNAGSSTIPSSSSRRLQDIRDRRQRLSEQRDYPSGSTSGASSAPSSSRLRALAEYDIALAESDAKRQRQTEEQRLNASKNEDREVPERRREKFKISSDDENKSYVKPKQQEESSNLSKRNTRLDEDQDKNAIRDQANNADKNRKSSSGYDQDKSGDIKLSSFTVRCQIIPSSNKEENENKPSVRLFCKWASPNSTSAINYYTIERQLGDNEWLPIGEKIDTSENQTQFDISSSDDNNNTDENNANIPSYFRLKAHLQNGQTFTSKPTDGIFINLLQEKKIIIPDVKILSPSSVELTWKDNEKEGNENEEHENEDNKNEGKTNSYDIEKKEEQQPEWEKVIEVPLSQRSARIDSLTDANQCQFRLIPSAIEVEEITEQANEVETKKTTKQKNEVELEETTEPENEIEPKETTKSENQIKSNEAKKPTSKIEPEETAESETEVAPKETTKSENKTKPKETTKEEDEVEPEETTEPETEVALKETTKSENESNPKKRQNTNSVKFEETAELENEVEPEETSELGNEVKPKETTKSENEIKSKEATKHKNTVEPEETAELKNEVEPEETTQTENEVEPEETAEPGSDAESEETTKAEDEVESEVLTVDNVNEWLNSLHVVPTSPTTVDVDISEEGFKEYDCYKIEYTTADQLNKWKQMSDITSDDPHLTIDKLKQGTNYKFRFTPVTSDTTTNEINSSQLSLVLDVQMPSARKGRFTKDESETPVAAPPQFTIQKLDPTSVLIEAVIPPEEPAIFEDVYDVYSKNETINDDDWTKVGTIDKEHLSTTVENLEENTAYAFKIDNITSPSSDDENTTIQEFKFDTTPVKQFDPSLFLEKIEQSLENVVNSVMQAAAGHQVLEEPVNKSLNEVIKEVFRDETLVPNEAFGFETLALNNDLQLYRGPKQMMLKDLEVDETLDLSKHEGEIIIHNYRTSQQSVIVREENGNTRVGNIDGDIIIRNVLSDVLLKNDKTNHQLSMNIVGQAFLKGVQGTLIASKFKGIIVVKNVHKP